MDQIRPYLDLAWKHRFWICQGVAIILSFIMFPAGTSQLAYRAKQKRDDLEGTYKTLEDLRSRPNPNPQWTENAQKKHGDLEQIIDGIWEEKYRAQKKLMAWPGELNTELVKDVKEGIISHGFEDRPFGEDLSDLRNRYLFRYRGMIAQHADEVYLLLDPLEQRADGSVVGAVEANFERLMNVPRFEGPPPTSSQAWLIQERFWVQRAILTAIARANAEAFELARQELGRSAAKEKAPAKNLVSPEDVKGWRYAAVRRLLAFKLGPTAVDFQTMVAKKGALFDLLEKKEAAPQAGGEGGYAGLVGGMIGSGRTGDMESARYLEDARGQFRTLPLYLSIYVDQRRIALVLAALSNSDLECVVRQVQMSAPEGRVRPAGVSTWAGGGYTEADAANDTLHLKIWAQVRLYEMPPKMLAAYEEAKKALAEGKPPAPPGAPAEGGASPPTSEAPAPGPVTDTTEVPPTN